MIELFLPNVKNYIPELLRSINQTIIMVSISGSISIFIGLFIGVFLVLTRSGNLFENKIIYKLLDTIINILRSIPFIILLAAIIPLTRFIVGTAIGTRGAIVPLVIGIIPLFSRQVESALLEVNEGIIEAAKSMGVSSLSIIFNVYLCEALPSIIRGGTITFISLVGFSAMAGSVGGGGLGDFAIRYGYQRFETDVTIVVVVIILIIVSFIQKIGTIIERNIKH